MKCLLYIVRRHVFLEYFYFYFYSLQAQLVSDLDVGSEHRLVLAALFLIYTSRRGLLERELRLLLCTYEKSQGKIVKPPTSSLLIELRIYIFNLCFYVSYAVSTVFFSKWIDFKIYLWISISSFVVPSQIQALSSVFYRIAAGRLCITDWGHTFERTLNLEMVEWTSVINHSQMRSRRSKILYNIYFLRSYTSNYTKLPVFIHL